LLLEEQEHPELERRAATRQVYRWRKLGSPDGLRLEPEATPALGTRDVLVRMRAFSLNYRDLMMARDQYPLPTKPDLIPLSDGAGEVVEVGSAVTRFKPGDRVASNFHQRWVGLPDRLSFEEGASLPCAAVTAWSAVLAGGPPGGQTVLVQGTGGVSIFALDFAKAMGARVIATTSSEEKAQYLRERGADVTINYREKPDWHEEARRLTGGLGVDLVVEVGGPGTFARSVASLRFAGVLSLVGLLEMSGDKIDPLSLMAVRVQPIVGGRREDFEDMLRAIDRLGLKPPLDKTFPFEAAPAAYAHFGARKHIGKVVIRD
jgi:NADPH:quinone reductase-like Zn-dependent oxidoreductase